MELIGTKRAKVQDAAIRIHTNGNNETSLFLSNDLIAKLPFRDNQPFSVVLNKDNVLKAICYAYSFPKKIYGKQEEIKLDPAWFADQTRKWNEFFGKNANALYKATVVLQTKNRNYLKGLKQEGSGFNIRDFLIEDYSELSFYREGDYIYLKISNSDPRPEENTGLWNQENQPDQSDQTENPEQEQFCIAAVPSDIQKTGLLYSDTLIYRFVLSLLTKPFVILSGLSGSGKTQLALAFARWICEDESQIRMVPVGADWTNREYLLGYPNALTEGEYVMPDNRVLETIIEAGEHPEKPYFLILDEMNLSYVERYFADFLSTMESGEVITLHPESDRWAESKLPSRLSLPRNLFIVGTINVDETTYMFSPKVLDRANVLEFRISGEDMEKFLAGIKPLQKRAADRLGAGMARSFVGLATDMEITPAGPEVLAAVLPGFFRELKKAGAEFGYRTAAEICRFVALAQHLKVEWNDDQIMDAAIMQKLLPKLHGSRKKMLIVLEALWNICVTDQGTSPSLDSWTDGQPFGPEFRYPMSAEKILRMYRSALDNGFTSFAEA